MYVDFSWCGIDNDGSYRLNMCETVEIKEQMVGYVDDITIQGSMPHFSSAKK